MTVTDALLNPVLAADAARPLITFYDDATGERIELSGATFGNWVAKTANLLRDECDVEPGTTVAVLLPAHWQAAAALCAIWWCGAEAVADPAGADVALATEDTLDAAAGAGLVVGFSLDAFGRGLGDGLPSGAVDYATEVRLQGDHFDPLTPVPDDAPALAGVDVAGVVAGARRRAAELGLGPDDRVLSTAAWPVTSTGGLVDGFLAVLAAGASLVHVRHPAGDQERRAGTEKVTRVLDA
ncbi:TIGR03089 family protein [Actinomycetospora chibensis]|uniref:TIGR03089 family protein n=1 Tax=Actinomycetospora chibensis TaxID=663606 RepID=A0ABV9RRM9_9PSEU|nr:TIGR03089 family protein [Actinomycetospora chibensis]MDD7924906.1 TIGR03089 family protein [Actinomycetospora chibensis]